MYVSMFVMWPVGRQLLSKEKLKAAIMYVDPPVYDLIKDEPIVVGFNVSVAFKVAGCPTLTTGIFIHYNCLDERRTDL